MYRGEGQWTDSDGPPELFLLTFAVPSELVKGVGKTHIFGCDEFATTLTVDAEQVPEVYLENLHAGMQRMTREEALRLQLHKKIRFYYVPLEFLQSTESVEYAYKGVTYPTKFSV